MTSLRCFVFSACLLIFLLGASLFLPHQALAFSGAGSGSSGSPYLVTSCSQLLEMGNSLSAYYKQTQNIDCNGTTFTSIGSTGSPFTGNLNGQGFTISNIVISTGGTYEGLFAASSTGATITNVHLVGGSVTAASYAASFVSSLQGTTTITDSSSSMTITANGAGGMVAVNQAGGFTTTITRSAFTGNLVSPGISYVGGIMAVVLTGHLTVTDCYTSGNYSGNQYVGGLVGYGDTVTISNCYSSASLTGTGGSSDVGGLVGTMTSGTITNSFAATSITTSSPFKGGAFGYADGTMSSVYFDITLAGTSSCTPAGSATCTGVNSGNTTPNYFKNNKTNPPMSAWNFAGVWQRTSTYPVFGIDAIDPVVTQNNEPSTSSPGPANPPGCSDLAPSAAPYLFQINSTGKQAVLYFTPNAQNVSQYVIAFGYASGDMRFGTAYSQSASNGVQQYVISDLNPGATYYFKIRAQNGCMPGNWSNELHISAFKNASFHKKIFYAQ